MKINESVNTFRKTLRHFELEIIFQNQNCCQTGITLAQCHTILDVELNEPTNITDIATRQGLDKSTISRTIEGLVTIGLISRIIHPKSRRQSSISLTEAGKQLCLFINAKNNIFYSTIFKEIDENELLVFFKIFNDITNKMKQLRKENPFKNCSK